MFYDADIFEDWEDPPTGLAAFLIWLRLWWELFWEDKDLCLPQEPLPLIRNRRDLRNAAHDRRRALPVVRNLTHYRVMGNRNITPMQFLERRCRLSPLGRVWIYRLPCRRLCKRGRVKRALRRSLHRASSGLWDAHLWPN